MRVLVVGAICVMPALVIRGFSDSAAENKPVQRTSQATEREIAARYSDSGYNVSRASQERIEKLAEKLSEWERQIILNKGTEQAFTGELYDTENPGVYTCRLCGLPLFSSEVKFKSGTGWPSFYKPVDAAHVHEEHDTTAGMVRTEISCARCRGHLGHVFNDGPRPTGMRYCMNSASLEFHERGTPLPPESQPLKPETAYVAGGCFWGIEDRMQQVPGVIDAVSGYQGGDVANPGYREVCSGTTGHAETVRVTFDPARVTYKQILEWFLRIHDPTQVNRQGPDIGTQYRSAIFVANDKQLEVATAVVEELQQSETYKGRKIATQIAQAGPFHEAEEYHQDYHAKHGGSCALPEVETPK